MQIYQICLTMLYVLGDKHIAWSSESSIPVPVLSVKQNRRSENDLLSFHLNHTNRIYSECATVRNFGPGAVLAGWWFSAVVASFVAWTKLLNVQPSQYWDGWPSSGRYTTSVRNKTNQVNSALHPYCAVQSDEATADHVSQARTLR